MSLQNRVRRMDEEIYGNESADEKPEKAPQNPVYDQLALLKTAFGHR